MRFALVILSAWLCLSVHAETVLPEKDSDEAIVAAAEQLIAEGGRLPATVEAKSDEVEVAPVVEATAASTAISEDMKKENDMPVFRKDEKLAKSESSMVWRLLGSLAFIGVVGATLIFAGRRWTKQKNKGGEKARIEILHQFHLGPKKSIALIRVAGEALLIGCTDHSINMLKSVALIDDELEDVMGKKDFNGFLEEDEFSVEDMRTALNQRN